MYLENVMNRVQEMDRVGIPVPVDTIRLLKDNGIIYSELVKLEEHEEV